MQATLSDFLYMHKGTIYLLECKQVAHDYRLPHGNFDPAQVARMRMWKMAGARSLVLIYHSTTKSWRYADIDYFINRTGGSWDLRDLKIHTLEEIL